ncbi:MAG: hypothetical protein R3C68_16580 [Myxococcota bacterium]
MAAPSNNLPFEESTAMAAEFIVKPKQMLRNPDPADLKDGWRNAKYTAHQNSAITTCRSR